MQAIKPIILTILALFNSKKGLAMLAGVVVSLLGLAGVIVDPAAVATILAPIIAYIVGQGLADGGKEAKKLEVAAIEKQIAASPKPQASPE